MPRVDAIAAVFAALALASCAASDPNAGSRQESGNWLGAMTGGWFASSSGTPAENSFAGVSSGGIIGGNLGANLNERERARAYAAEMQALETGEPGSPIGWRGEVPGHHGTVVPGAYYETKGMRCRAYSHTIYIDGKPQTARSTACRNPDGSWSPVG